MELTLANYRDATVDWLNGLPEWQFNRPPDKLDLAERIGRVNQALLFAWYDGNVPARLPGTKMSVASVLRNQLTAWLFGWGHSDTWVGLDLAHTLAVERFVMSLTPEQTKAALQEANASVPVPARRQLDWARYLGQAPKPAAPDF